MIYEFMPTQSYNGYDKPWAGGTGINMIDFPVFEAGTPSNTTVDSSTPRIFTDDTYIIGMTASNYYSPSRVTDVVKGDNSISFNSVSNSYGVAVKLPDIDPGETVTISVKSHKNDIMLMSFYDVDGNYLSNSPTSYDGVLTVTVPENTVQSLLIIRPVNYEAGIIEISGLMLESGSEAHSFEPYANVCMPEGFNIWDPYNAEFIQVYAGYVNANTRELYLRPVYEEYAGEELVGPWMSSLDPYEEDTTPTEGAFVIDFGGDLTSFEITPFALQTLLDSLGIRQHFTDGAGLLNSLMDQAQGRVRSEDELLHLSRTLKVIPIGDQLPAGLKIRPISKDVLPGLPGKFIR